MASSVLNGLRAQVAATGAAFAARLLGETTDRLVVTGQGDIQFSSGAAAADVTISRSGISTLAVTGSAAFSGDVTAPNLDLALASYLMTPGVI